MSRSNTLTVIILTYNEEANITDCLDSLENIQANIYVVDSFSTDQTIDILKKRNIQYVQHPFENYSRQRNWAQKNCPFDTPWILHLDAGERLTPNLVQWINQSFDKEKELYDGFMFSRKTVFLGKWIRFGGHYPNYHLRLYKRGKGKCEDKIYDQHFVVDGKVKALKKGNDMIDTVCDNIIDFIKGHSKWIVFEASERLLNSREVGDVQSNFFGNKIERRRWLKNNIFQKTPLFIRSILYFIYRYFIRLGFLDGIQGLVFHFLQGFWFRFMIDAVIFHVKWVARKEHLDIKQVLKQRYNMNFDNE